MFVIGVLCILLASASAYECEESIIRACSVIRTAEEIVTSDCHAKYGSIDRLIADLQALATSHIYVSFDLILMSTMFGNYEMNRNGFRDFYRKLSDATWDKAIDILKYIGERGGNPNFHILSDLPKKRRQQVYDVTELSSLAKALDLLRALAIDTMILQKKALSYGDPGVANYLAEEFTVSQMEIVRTLAGHVADLQLLLHTNDPSLTIFLFDEYLQKTL